MNLSARAIDFPKVVILATLIICALGVAGIFQLPKERKPRVRLPVVLVAVPYPGAQPPEIERQIINVIDDETATLSNLRDHGAVLAQANQGMALIQFIFNDDVDVVEAKRDVESLINRVKGQFPVEAQSDPGPIVADIAYDDWPIIQVFVAGGVDGKRRRDVAESLQDLIEKVDGVSTVNLFGGLEDEIHIDVDPHTMSLYGFSYEQVDAAIRSAVTSTPGGKIEGSAGSDRGVEVRGEPRDIESIRRIPLGTRDGKPIELADIADVHTGSKPRTSMARYGGADAVVLLVMGRTDIDMLATAGAVRQTVDRFQRSGDAAGMHIGTLRSQAREINYMVDQLGASAIYGTVLVFATLMLAMGWRLAGLIGIAVPFALLATAATMWAAKLTFADDLAINNMTLFAAILVIGMVVDGCIIVGENIYRHRELGRSAPDAAKRGIGEVERSLLAAYLTTFASFVPMFLVRGVVGDFVSLLPTVVLFALVGAMIVDHFVLPVLSMYVLRKRGEAAPVPLTDDATLEAQEIQRVEALSSASWFRRAYGGALDTTMAMRRPLVVLTLLLGFTPIGLYATGLLGLDFFPDSDMANIEVHYELPLGSAMETDTADVAAAVEAAVLRAVQPDEWHRPNADGPAVKPVSVIGDAGPLSTRLDTPGGSGPEFGMTYIELCLREDRQRHVSQIRRAILDELPPMPGVIVRCETPTEGPPAGAPVAIRILGDDDTPIDVLAARAAEAERLLREVPGVRDVTNDYRVRPQVYVDPQDTIASLYELSTARIKTAITYALEGVEVGEANIAGAEMIDLRLRNAQPHRDELADLARLPLRSETGRVVQLQQVAAIDRVFRPDTIRHRDGKRIINIRCQLADGVLADDVKLAMLTRLQPQLADAERRAALAAGDDILAADEATTIEFGGENELRDDALADLIFALGVSVLLMLVVLTIKFNSFVQPVIVLISVPMSLVGVAVGLLVCGYPFSMSVMIGIVALAGIVVNDAIVLVDFINALRDRGVPMRRAVVYAGQLRLRPIMLTTVTTIAGLLPLAVNIAGGGEFFQPLAVTIICGLGFATLQQLLIVPMMCFMFDFSAKPVPSAEKPAPAPKPDRRPMVTAALESLGSV